MARGFSISSLVIGAGLGAASMYLLDPQRGTRRRKGALSRMRGAVNDVEHLAGKAARDVENRAHGLAARARGAGPSRRTRTILSEGTPERRLLEGGSGALLAVWGLARGGLVGTAALVTGAALVARGALAPLEGQIHVQKTITIHVPVADVFRFFSHFENFPRFMRHVHDVTVDGTRSHWRITGPAGVPVEWDAELLESVEPRKLVWRSVAGAPIQHHGEVHFERVAEDTTRISVHLSYHPPGGAIGHAAAAFLHGDPKALMDDDLLRLKSLLEQGKTRHAGHEVRIGELLH